MANIIYNDQIKINSIPSKIKGQICPSVFLGLFFSLLPLVLENQTHAGELPTQESKSGVSQNPNSPEETNKNLKSDDPSKDKAGIYKQLMDSDPKKATNYARDKKKIYLDKVKRLTDKNGGALPHADSQQLYELQSKTGKWHQRQIDAFKKASGSELEDKKKATSQKLESDLQKEKADLKNKYK